MVEWFFEQGVSVMIVDQEGRFVMVYIQKGLKMRGLFLVQFINLMGLSNLYWIDDGGISVLYYVVQ